MLVKTGQGLTILSNRTTDVPNHCSACTNKGIKMVLLYHWGGTIFCIFSMNTLVYAHGMFGIFISAVEVDAPEQGKH